MTAQDKQTIKSYFETGDKPNQGQFADLIDSYQDAGANLTVVSAFTSAMMNNLNAIVQVSALGILTRTATSAATVRTITGTTGEIAITNGNGVAGNPIISVPTSVVNTGKIITGGTYQGATITSAASIQFGNGATLSIYEEADFTPTFFGSSVAGTPTGTFAGHYTRIGNTVNVWVRGDFSGLGGLSGDLRMSGLPYAVNASNTARGGCAVGFRSNSNSFTGSLIGYTRQGASEVWFFNGNADNTAITDANLAASFDIYFHTTYYI